MNQSTCDRLHRPPTTQGESATARGAVLSYCSTPFVAVWRHIDANPHGPLRPQQDCVFDRFPQGWDILEGVCPIPLHPSSGPLVVVSAPAVVHHAIAPSLKDSTLTLYWTLQARFNSDAMGAQFRDTFSNSVLTQGQDFAFNFEHDGRKIMFALKATQMFSSDLGAVAAGA